MLKLDADTDESKNEMPYIYIWCGKVPGSALQQRRIPIHVTITAWSPILFSFLLFLILSSFLPASLFVSFLRRYLLLFFASSSSCCCSVRAADSGSSSLSTSLHFFFSFFCSLPDFFPSRHSHSCPVSFQNPLVFILSSQSIFSLRLRMSSSVLVPGTLAFHLLFLPVIRSIFCCCCCCFFFFCLTVCGHRIKFASF